MILLTNILNCNLEIFLKKETRNIFCPIAWLGKMSDPVEMSEARLMMLS